MFMYCFLYSMGISSWVLTPVVTPIFLSNAEANMALAEAGTATNATLAIATDATVYSAYLWIGGIGCTMTLVLMMAFMAKSAQLKTLGRACLIPAIFNINEPVVFGTVAWNPIMMVPMWLQGIVLPLVTFLLTKIIPLAPVPSMLFNMWYCPFPIATWLTTGSIMGIALMAINFALSWLIWMPFFRTYDKQLVEKETAEAEEDDDDDWSF
jgi:PTS system cellobiose-specific IIC component